MDDRKQLSDITIYQDDEYTDREIRVYDSGSVLQSATYIDEGSRNELIFEYMKQFNRALQLKPDASDMLMFGGARYAYPKYIISHYPDITVDVVEIDPQAYQTACQFFYLDELIRDYNLNDTHRLNNIVDDAHDFIYKACKKYDIIIDDTFNDVEPVYSLLTRESFSQIKSLLKEGGIYMRNLSGHRKIQKTAYLLDILKTRQQVFCDVKLVKAFFFRYARIGNYVVLASDQSLDISDALNFNTDKAEIITDAEVEILAEKFNDFCE